MRIQYTEADAFPFNPGEAVEGTVVADLYARALDAGMGGAPFEDELTSKDGTQKQRVTLRTLSLQPPAVTPEGMVFDGRFEVVDVLDDDEGADEPRVELDDAPAAA